MRKLIVTLALVFSALFSLSAFGQAYDPLLTEISSDALAMKNYALDPMAEAVVLNSAGNIRFVENSYGQFEVHFVKRIQIKIFNKDGYRFGEVEVPFFNGNGIKESIDIKKATTYNLENGQVTKSEFDPKAVFIEKINKNWQRIKFALPSIKDGSVIDYEYEFVTDSKSSLPGWTFQSAIPVINSKLSLGVVPFYQYQFLLQGTNKFTSQKSKTGTDIKYFRDKPYYDMTYDFEMKNLPAFRDEAFITSINDYLIKVDFQLSKIIQPSGLSENYVTTWTALNDELLKSSYFGKYISSSEKPAETFLKTINLSSLSNLEKIEKISDLIKVKFKFDGNETKYVQRTPKEFIDQKTGNSAEINLFLLACLKKQNFEAYPVLLSTRDNGKIKVNYPFLDFLNYVIVCANVDGRKILLDATNIFLPFDRIPINCINESGLVVQKNDESWIDLTSTDQSSSIIEKINILIDTEKEFLDCSLNITSNGYGATEMKERTGSKYEKIKEDLSSRGLNPLDSIKIENFEDSKRDYILSFNSQQKYGKIDNKIILAPFLQEAEQSNNLKSLTRKYPVDFIFKKNKQLEASFKIPKGYKISYLPENYSVDNDLVTISYSTSNLNDVVTITGKYEFKKSVYPPQNYNQLRDFISEIVKRFNDKILIEKI